MKSFTADKNTTLKDFTDGAYPQGSFYFAALIKKGDIRVNGVRVHKNCPISAGDTIIYYTTPAQEAKPSHICVYEDDNIIVADKYSGVSSEALFCELKDKAAYPVHRLDRNTSGLIVLAKSAQAQEALISAFKERQVQKTYFCLAKNNFKGKEADMVAYLEKGTDGKVAVFGKPAEGRVKILTSYSVQKEMGDIALVKVTLHTGKTHQIRAHLAYIGCPVLGDGKYGDGALNKKYNLSRQQLVAQSLKFNLRGPLEYLNSKTFTSSFFPTK